MNYQQKVWGPPKREPSDAWRGVGEGSGGLSKTNRTPDEDSDAMGPCRLLRHLQSKLAQMGFGLYPLTGDILLLTNPRLGMSRTLPDLRAATVFARSLEVRHG